MARAPFAPATELIHVPFVLWEIQALANEGNAEAIKPLIRSVIAVTLSQPDSWQQIEKMSAN